MSSIGQPARIQSGRGAMRRVVASAPGVPPAGWLVYLLECKDGSLYTGVTNDLEARVKAHVAGTGAKYTRAHPPRRVLAWGSQPDRSSACRVEWTVKQMRKSAKVQTLCAMSEECSHV